MLGRCLTVTFWANDSCAVTDRRRDALPAGPATARSPSKRVSSRLDEDDTADEPEAGDMSGNQRQSLLAGDYDRRRELLQLPTHKSPLAAFKTQLAAPTRPQEQQQQQEQQEQPAEWPELPGVDAKTLFAVEPHAVKIGREIGKGAFSVVFAGEYRGQHVAVKCQPKDAEGNIPAFVLREVQVLRQLHHPRLLQFAGAVDHTRAKQVWILSEYLNNGDVDQLLKDVRAGKRPHVGWLRLVRIALDAALGMQFLQERHVVHRDIKSSNILLDDQHRAKLCDFGFATEIKPATASATAHGGAEAEESKERRKSYCGTDAYMAPEMFLDEDYDVSVDIFSFGVVLMEMLCCRVANADGFLMRLPQFKFRVLLPEFRAALPASCPSALATLAEQCVSFEPRERPEIHAIVRALEAVLARSGALSEVVELIPFTPDEREPQIEDDDAYYGENDDDEEEEEDEDEDEDDECEDDDCGGNSQPAVTARHNTMGMESDEEDRDVPSQIVNDPYLDDEGSVGRVDSDLLPPLTPAPYHEGMVLKRNRRGKRSWAEKWFIVDHDHLHYTDLPPRWQQQQQSAGWRCTLPPISSLSLRECRIWKTMEMPELRFNVIDSNWKIKRELQALSKRELELWMELISQGIDYANQLYAREHDLPNNSTSASGSNSSRPSRSSTSKPQPPRAKAYSDAAPRKPRRSRGSSVTAGFDEPPETPETAEDRADEVFVWLKQIGFQRYTATLKAKGFSSLDFIRETGVEMEDLNFLGIKEPSARKAIRSAARALRGEEEDD